MISSPVKLFSPAKLNLFLRVFGPRKDGYHPIQSVFQSVDFGDDIFVERTEAKGCSVDALYTTVARAYDLLESRLSFGIRVSLEKRIPMGAGLGGGSSNAAVVLKYLNDEGKLGLSESELMALGVQIGADVPFFIRGGTGFVQGIGEFVSSIPEVQSWFLIVSPGVSLETAFMYGRLDEVGQFSTYPGIIEVDPHWRRESRENSFFAVAKQACSEIRDLDLFVAREGGQLRLSGSGACCFLELGSESEALAWQARVLERFSGMKAWVCRAS